MRIEEDIPRKSPFPSSKPEESEVNLMKKILVDYPRGLPEELDLSNDDWLLDTLRCWNEHERQHALDHFIRIKGYVGGYGLNRCESHEEYFSTYESQASQSVRAMLNIVYHCRAFRDRILPQLVYLNLIFCVAPRNTFLWQVDSFVQLTNFFKRINQRTTILVKRIYVASLETLTPAGSERYKELEPFHTFYTHCDFGVSMVVSLRQEAGGAEAESSYKLASPFSTYSRPKDVAITNIKFMFKNYRSSLFELRTTTAAILASSALNPTTRLRRMVSVLSCLTTPVTISGPRSCPTSILCRSSPSKCYISNICTRSRSSLHHQHNNTTSSTSAAGLSHVRQHNALSSRANRGEIGGARRIRRNQRPLGAHLALPCIIIVLSSSKVFMMAGSSSQSQAINPRTMQTVRSLPTIPGMMRTYPFTAAIAPLPWSYANAWKSEILVCGGFITIITPPLLRLARRILHSTIYYPQEGKVLVNLRLDSVAMDWESG
ncbi:hypothetical protein EJ08DRAFT_658887 [Tothia fuscella]|uniref:Uncharacterized protein n=1 Tax=Tothia fuscella TaxID=1048955 RepID=A0A9P4NVP1_9PEZI|nr:hypothetical protein EJ08DRAFT_658887 [Tothia fuscella]